MESISRATCSLGLIVYSFNCKYWPLINEHGRRDDSRSSYKVLQNFVSATEDLLEILESLNSSSHNPMGDLPPKFECTAETCATDVEHIRRDMGKGVDMASFPFHLDLDILKLRTWTSTLQSYNDLLSPHVKSLAR